jgi:hypothetical protein
LGDKTIQTVAATNALDPQRGRGEKTEKLQGQRQRQQIKLEEGQLFRWKVLGNYP